MNTDVKRATGAAALWRSKLIHAKVRHLTLFAAALATVFACGPRERAARDADPAGPTSDALHPEHPSVWARGSIVNTTYNTYKDGSGRWTSTMGPLSPNRDGGIVCDHVDRKYRDGDYAMWFVAPSDAVELGIAPCGGNPWGGEPSCRENYHRCGQAVRITCTDSQWCAKASGSPSIYADYVAGKRPTNNYIPDIYVDMLRNKYGKAPPVTASVVLYVTDFCPRNHSANRSSGNCQGPQVDISTAAFLLLAKRNAQGYINSGISYKVEMLHRLPRELGPQPDLLNDERPPDAGIDAAAQWDAAGATTREDSVK